MEKRRQNHSCDQCRRSKKACDGYLVNSSQARLAGTNFEPTSLEGRDITPSQAPLGILPCSYCQRTKKSCSLNPHWVSQDRPRNPGSLPLTDESNPEESGPQVKRQRFGSINDDSSPDSFAIPAIPPANDVSADLFHAPSQNGDAFGWDTPFSVGEHHPITASTGPPHSTEAVAQSFTAVPALDHLDFMPFTPRNDPVDAIPHPSLDAFPAASTTEYSSDPSSLDAPSTVFDIPSLLPTTYRSPVSSTSSPRGKSRKTHGNGRSGEQPRDYPNMSLSPFSVEYLAMSNTNRSLISESLLRIYHDVMENNLACWLAEDTCPYKMQRRRDQLVLVHQDASTSGQIHAEWGSSWSNRMYNRVKQLDRVALSTGLVHLSPSESRRVSRALQLSIIAFATQWAQGDGRRQQGYLGRPAGFDDGLAGSDDALGDEFEQTLQQSLWDQARRALHDVADLECYRVVFAELVFGMIQKPWALDEQGRHLVESLRIPGQDGSVRNSILPQIMEIISQAGPPVFLERAARKIHALKYRFEAREAGLRKGDGGYGMMSGDEKAIQNIGMEERQTVGLLYWFAVMTDTVSSSMNERPVVVSDDQCPHDAAQETPPKDNTSASTALLGKRWELDLYAQDDPEKPSELHWPCSYEAATKAVTKSAAVKVLFFRHISYLQNSIRNVESGPAIEEVIRVTLSVYRYWYKTHGALFRDLTRNYSSTPARIKSWFTCIAIPWHLGSLMFADLVDIVDAEGLGLEASSAERKRTYLSKKIRRTSAIELADLAAVSTPRDISAMGVEQLPDFHFAVNESPLLTEPWTMLLIRAFTKASLYHLGQVEELQKNGWARVEELRASTRWGRSCIKALQLLGTKSDMAKAISSVLFRPLEPYEKSSQDSHIPSEVHVF